jgi:hypothetical protein
MTPPAQRRVTGDHSQTFMDDATRAVFKPAADLLGLPVEVLWEAGQKARAEAARTVTQRASTESRPRWETRQGDDLELTPEQFVAKHYAAKMAKVTPRPIWNEEGPYGNRPAEWIAIAYRPEMLAGTLHYKMIRHGTKTGNKLIKKLISLLRTHRPELTEVLPGTHKQTYQERIG